MKKHVRLAAVMAAVVGLVVTACSSGGGKATTSSSAAGSSGASSSAAAAAAPWTCLSSTATQTAPGDPLLFSWGPGSTLDGVNKYLKPAVQTDLGLNMTATGAASSDTMAKIEGQGGSGGDYDVIFTSDGPLQDGRTKNVLAPLDYSKLPETKNIPTNLLDPKAGGNLAITVSQFAYGLAYNTKILADKGLPAPTSVKDMLNPIYGPVLGLYVPPFAGAVTQIAVFNKILGGPPNDLSTGIKALAALKPAEEVSNSGQIDNDFAAGKVGMYFAASATVQTSLDSGLPVKMVFNPIYGSGIYAVIPKDPPHPAAACEFMNWIASVDGQNALQKVNGNAPTRTAGVTVRQDTVMASIAGQPVLSYPDLIATAPTTAQVTEQWNAAAH